MIKKWILFALLLITIGVIYIPIFLIVKNINEILFSYIFVLFGKNCFVMAP